MIISIKDTTYGQISDILADARQRVRTTADLTARHAWNAGSNPSYENLLAQAHARNLDHLAKVATMMEAWARYHGRWAAA
jgi:hypothetical protein